MFILKASLHSISPSSPAAQTAADITILWSLQPSALPPESFFTPVISILSVPTPLILAPALFKNLAKSSISGSFAALVNTVVPSAKHEANIIFSVAPTLGKSRFISDGVIFSVSHIIFPKF